MESKKIYTPRKFLRIYGMFTNDHDHAVINISHTYVLLYFNFFHSKNIFSTVIKQN